MDMDGYNERHVRDVVEAISDFLKREDGEDAIPAAELADAMTEDLVREWYPSAHPVSTEEVWAAYQLLTAFHHPQALIPYGPNVGKPRITR